MTVYSTEKQAKEIAAYLTSYMRIPFFQDDAIPGQIMEKIISKVHGARQLPTYDYVDVVIEGNDGSKKGNVIKGVGWSVKSTKESTPLTWKRAKIEKKRSLIEASEDADESISAIGLQALGDAIIDFCNDHAQQSMDKHNLDEIGYSRLIMFENNTAIYFEKLLCSKLKPLIFDKADYIWKWSSQKKTGRHPLY